MPPGQRLLQGSRFDVPLTGPAWQGNNLAPLRRFIWIGTEMVRRPSLAGMTWGSPVLLIRVTLMQPLDLDVVQRDDHLLDQEPHDPLLLSRQEPVPYLVQPGHGDRDLRLVQHRVELDRTGQRCRSPLRELAECRASTASSSAAGRRGRPEAPACSIFSRVER